MINMLTELAKKFKVLNHTFPKDMILDNVVLQLFESGGGKTIKDLISLIPKGLKTEMSKVGQIILNIIKDTKDKN